MLCIVDDINIVHKVIPYLIRHIYVQALNTAVKGEPVAMLLSPSSSSPIHGTVDPRQPSGSQFTSFLKAPLQAFLILLGYSGSDIQMVRVSL